MKKIIASLLLCGAAFSYAAGETITITSPANNSIVSGTNTVFAGTASLPNALVALRLNGVFITNVLTGPGGNWSFNYPSQLSNGSYILEARLMEGFTTLATAANTFFVTDSYLIAFRSPRENEQVPTLERPIAGLSNFPGTFVRVFVDSVDTGTVATDGHSGDWQSPYPFLNNGDHSVLVQLLSPDLSEVLATDLEEFSSFNPILYQGATQIRIVQGRVPTSGNGSGSGFTYAVAGSVVTITFTPSFNTVPIVLALGERSPGPSTVTLNASSSTSIALEFSAGTQFVHFQAIRS